MSTFEELSISFRPKNALLRIDAGRQCGVSWSRAKRCVGGNQCSLGVDLECGVFAPEASVTAPLEHREMVNEVAPRRGERKFAVWPTADFICIGVGLTVIFPPAYGADFVGGWLMECRETATWAAILCLTEKTLNHADSLCSKKPISA